MQSIKNTVGLIFIACLAVLSAIPILGVWSVLPPSIVVARSFETFSILALVSVIVIVAARFIDASPSTNVASSMGSLFKTIRSQTLVLLVVSTSLLALVGVLGIWDVITSADVLHKSLISTAIVAFVSYIAVVVCLERENHPLWQKRSGEFFVGGFVAFVILFWVLRFAGFF